jgi:16S rRNA (guanine527-N7)-methyltransferase
MGSADTMRCPIDSTSASRGRRRATGLSGYHIPGVEHFRALEWTPMAKLRPPERGWPLGKAAEALGASLATTAESALADWLDLLVEWNARVDLTAARGTDELVDLMVADALVLSKCLPEGARVIDVGTGAGAPGLALALLRPDLDMTLVEPLGKRGAFLRTVIGRRERLDVKLETKSGEAVLKGREGAWDVALSRATLPPAEWLALASRLVAPTGSAWAFLAREAAPSVSGMTEVEALAYAWPLTKADRRLVRYSKETSE